LAIDGVDTVLSAGVSGGAIDSLFLTGSDMVFTTDLLQVNGNIKIPSAKSMFIGSSGNLIVGGDTNVVLPSGISGAIQLMDNGGGSFANATNGFAFWSNGGSPQYRGYLTDEGEGRDHWIHNRETLVQCSGTDYSATTAAAKVDFSGTDPDFTLPTEGTYFVSIDTVILNGATPTDEYKAKLRNTTTSTDIASSEERISSIAANARMPVHVTGLVSGSAGDVISLYGFNSTPAARGTFESASTRIKAFRLH